MLNKKVWLEEKNETTEKNNVIKEIFTLQFFSQFRVIFIWLALFGLSNVYATKINSIYDNIKYNVNEILNSNLWYNLNESKQKEIEKIFLNVVNELWYNNPEDPVFQQKLYSEIKNYEEITWTKLIQSLLLWFLYGFAYLKTINRVKNENLKIDVKSFTTFSLTSWWMVLVNWFVPWSLVYIESFILAWYTVYLHLKNEVNQKKVDSKNFSIN